MGLLEFVPTDRGWSSRDERKKKIYGANSVSVDFFVGCSLLFALMSWGQREGGEESSTTSIWGWTRNGMTLGEREKEQKGVSQSG